MILITGGMGFVGLHTARAIVDAGEDVVITYYQTWREPSFIKDEYGKRVQVEQLDIGNREDVLAIGKKHKITAIIHLAPSTRALGPVDDLKANLPGFTNVLEASLEWGVQRVMLGSSSTVYFGLQVGPFREDQMLPLWSTNPTEAFKKAWEALGLHFASRTGQEIIPMRIGAIWGPAYHSMLHVVSRWTHAAVSGREPDYSRGGVPFEEDAHDLCYVKDCAVGIQLLTMAPNLNHGIYNVAQGYATTNREVVATIEGIVRGAKLKIEPGRGPRWRKDPYADLSRIKADVDYEPQYTFRSAMEEYVAWLRENEE